MVQKRKMCYFTVFALIYFVFCYLTVSKYKLPGNYIRGSDLQEGCFCVTSLQGLYLEGLIHEGDYFGNFTSFREYFGTNGFCLSGYFRILRTCDKHVIRIKQPSFRSHFLETVS